MKLKQLIELNGADPNQYSEKDLKQIKFLLTTQKVPAFVAHKQLVEKYKFMCTADNPCRHEEQVNWVELMSDINRLHTEIYGTTS